MRPPHAISSARLVAAALLLALLLETAARDAVAAKSAAPHPPAIPVASFGGGIQDAQRNALFDPFTAQTGIPIQLQGWDGALSTLRTRAASGATDWDLVLIEAATLQQACKEGLMLPQPLTADPADPAPDSSGQDCGVEAWRMTIVLAWDKSRVDTAPSWGDFWDVARRPGKRGLRRDPRGTLEIALIADGVAPDDVYRTLATQEGVDRAFRKLDQLKPYIVWWNTPAEAVQTIESGAVLMTSAPDGEVAMADLAGHRNFGTQQAQSLGELVDWAVPRGLPAERRGPAFELLHYVADAAHRSAFDAAYPPAGTDRTAAPPVKPSLMMDQGFWDSHLSALQQRFDGWVASR